MHILKEILKKIKVNKNRKVHPEDSNGASRCLLPRLLTFGLVFPLKYQNALRGLHFSDLGHHKAMTIIGLWLRSMCCVLVFLTKYICAAPQGCVQSFRSGEHRLANLEEAQNSNPRCASRSLRGGLQECCSQGLTLDILIASALVKPHSITRFLQFLPGVSK